MTERTGASQHHLDSAVSRYRRRSLLGTLVVTLTLVLFIFLFLQYSLSMIRDKTDELNKLNGQLSDVQEKLGATKAQLDAATQRIAEAANFVTHVHKLDWENTKLMSVNYLGAAELLQFIEPFVGKVPFSNKNNPTDGFNSPGFAAYVLSRKTGSPVDVLALKPRNGSLPHPGDLVRYKVGNGLGYAMFYFVDPTPGSQAPFVVGMTPIGIAALDYQFGPAIADILITPFSSPNP